MWQKSGWWWRAFCCWVRPEAGPRGLEVGGCQVMEMLCYLKLTELCLLCVCSSVLGVFLYLEFPFLSLLEREILPIFRGPVPVLPCPWSSSCSPFLVELTAPSFLLPRTSLLFYYSTDSVFLGVFLPPYLTVISLSRWFVSDTFQVFLSRSCTFSSYFLKWTEWLIS